MFKIKQKIFISIIISLVQLILFVGLLNCQDISSKDNCNCEMQGLIGLGESNESCCKFERSIDINIPIHFLFNSYNERTDKFSSGYFLANLQSHLLEQNISLRQSLKTHSSENSPSQVKIYDSISSYLC